MQSKKEICSYFLRGSCKFGDRCKNLHVPPSQQQQQQQPKANGFSFGTQRQQHPNPFGFGVKSGPQSGGLTDSGSRHNQYKWNRSSPSTNASSQRQSDSQPVKEHECTDPKSCQDVIAADSKERPLWKLTCYAHFKYLPCDISGDVSYEELRAAAYEDAKRGLNLQAIVERERGLISSKLAEFSNLERNPLSAATPNAFSSAASTSNPPVVSSFAQAASWTTNNGARQGSSEPAGAFFGNSSSFANPASAFGPNSFQSTGLNSFQFPTTPMHGSSPASGTPSFITNSTFGPASNTFPAPFFSPQPLSATSHQPTSGLRQTAEKTFMPVQSNSTTPQTNGSSQDLSIWMKEEWLPGEVERICLPPSYFLSVENTWSDDFVSNGFRCLQIPEEAPPNEFVV